MFVCLYDSVGALGCVVVDGWQPVNTKKQTTGKKSNDFERRKQITNGCFCSMAVRCKSTLYFGLN